jgi:carbamoylphosphate synthase small subunit
MKTPTKKKQKSRVVHAAPVFSPAERERREAALNTRARRMEVVALVQADERTVLKELRAPGACKGSVGERIREYFATGKLAERVPEGVAS